MPDFFYSLLLSSELGYLVAVSSDTSSLKLNEEYQIMTWQLCQFFNLEYYLVNKIHLAFYMFYVSIFGSD